jgi:hypothetical protein
MAGMALLSLTFALSTVQNRRKNDPKPLPVLEPPLSYLPQGYDLILGVQVAEARRTTAGQTFLGRSQLDDLGFTLADLEGAIGLKLTDVEQVVFGVRIEDMRMTLVVRTRQPYDPAAIRTALQASRRSEISGREVYHFTLEKRHLSAVLWSPDVQTLVIGLSPKDITAIPTPSGELPVPTALADLLRKRMNTRNVLWAAGRFEKGAALRDLLAAQLGDKEREALAQVQTFALGLELDPQVKLSFSVACKDAAGAAGVEQALSKLKANDGARLKVLGSGPEGLRVAQELARTFQTICEGTMVTVEASAKAPH